MRLLFIKDIRVKFAESPLIYSDEDYARVLNASDRIETDKLFGNVLVKNAGLQDVFNFFDHLSGEESKTIKSVTFEVDGKDDFINRFKSAYTIVKAAGGLVKKGDHYLMIYRSGKWDLPKGKTEDREKSMHAAIREVEEECNIEARVEDKICSTWHNYYRDGQHVLKKTKWYLMHVINDDHMQAQAAEDIHEVRWLDEKELNQAFSNTYRSIIEVFKQYGKKFKV